MTTPGEITIGQQSTQNVRLALYELRALGIIDRVQIDEAREYIDDGRTCVENEDCDEYQFSTLDSFRNMILSQTSQIN